MTDREWLWVFVGIALLLVVLLIGVAIGEVMERKGAEEAHDG